MSTVVAPAVSALAHSERTLCGSALGRGGTASPAGFSGWPDGIQLLPGNVAHELRKMSILINVVTDHRTVGARGRGTL